MLKGIPSILPPNLLKALAEMGHTDELTIGDGNFPGHTYGKHIIRMDGHGGIEVLDAILTLFPLDTYVEKPVVLMEKVKGDTIETPIWNEYKNIVNKYDSRGTDCFEWISKGQFYERCRSSYVVIMTGEEALYANIILKKGVIAGQ